MKKRQLTITWQEFSVEELTIMDRSLVESAMKATANSYSPYSGFSVGAAVLLADGSIITGSNQENAAYPSGLCAERTALFAAGASAPSQPITAIAIAAYTDGHFTDQPITPCGSCRQVMTECENRYNKPIRIILYGKQRVMVFNRGISQLLPFCFREESMR